MEVKQQGDLKEFSSRGNSDKDIATTKIQKENLEKSSTSDKDSTADPTYALSMDGSTYDNNRKFLPKRWKGKARPGQSKGYDGYAAPVNIESEPPSPEVIDLEQHLTSYELNPCDPLNNPCVNTRQSMCEVSDNNEDRSANMDHSRSSV